MAVLTVDVRKAMAEEQKVYDDLLEIYKHYRISEIARALGVSRKQVYKWIYRTAFPENYIQVCLIKDKASELRQQQLSPSSSP